MPYKTHHMVSAALKNVFFNVQKFQVLDKYIKKLLDTSVNCTIPKAFNKNQLFLKYLKSQKISKDIASCLIFIFFQKSQFKIFKN